MQEVFDNKVVSPAVLAGRMAMLRASIYIPSGGSSSTWQRTWKSRDQELFPKDSSADQCRYGLLILVESRVNVGHGETLK